MMCRVIRLSGLVLMSLWVAAVAEAASIPIENASFELPRTNFVEPNIASWQKGPVPLWYTPSMGYDWSQLTGAFVNVAPGAPEYIDNCDANQAAWMFAVPDVQLYQDLAATFEVGQCYQLTVGVLGGAGNMKDGVPLELRLYYRDANDVQVVVGATTFTYHPATAQPNHFQDVQLSIPAVRETDPWAGRKIGVQIISSLTLADLDPKTGRAGGYWDIDNVRLTRTGVQEAGLEADR